MTKNHPRAGSTARQLESKTVADDVINPLSLSPQQLAEHVREGMWHNDRASQALGMQVVSIAPGHCVIRMTVRRDMLNGHDICHGGLITTLADSAFAFACNAYNELSVAAGFAVDISAPAREGDVLTADCHEVEKGGRLGLYDVDVRNQDGQRVALFRGRSYTMRGKPAVSSKPPGAPPA